MLLIIIIISKKNQIHNQNKNRHLSNYQNWISLYFLDWLKCFNTAVTMKQQLNLNQH